jgi:hypothetical protein
MSAIIHKFQTGFIYHYNFIIIQSITLWMLLYYFIQYPQYFKKTNLLVITSVVMLYFLKNNVVVRIPNLVFLLQWLEIFKKSLEKRVTLNSHFFKKPLTSNVNFISMRILFLVLIEGLLICLVYLETYSIVDLCFVLEQNLLEVKETTQFVKEAQNQLDTMIKTHEELLNFL